LYLFRLSLKIIPTHYVTSNNPAVVVPDWLLVMFGLACASAITAFHFSMQKLKIVLVGVQVFATQWAVTRIHVATCLQTLGTDDLYLSEIL
jgi:hypothetical protein